MRSTVFFPSVSTLFLVWLVPCVFAGLYPPDAVDHLAEAGLVNLGHYLSNRSSDSQCTLETAARRREWADLSVPEREDYISAVLCLQELPSRHNNATAPGARSRFDDFVAAHIQFTLSIHGTANFLSWHRVFTWLYEKALREECGLKGYHPYNNWGRHAADPANSPIFNGNSSSMSGNGAKYEYGGVPFPQYPPPYNLLPPDEGGGCVTDGPFRNMTVNLGPVAPGSPKLNVPANPRADGLGYNPRCLRRDINRYSAAHTAANYTEALITNTSNIGAFQDTMQGQARPDDWGVHTAGHFTIGGDPGGDFYASPGDPAFFLHHAMIDRVWWIWQNRDLPSRLRQVTGPITLGNVPPSRNGTLDDKLEYGVLGDDVRLGDALETTAGPFCYIYI